MEASKPDLTQCDASELANFLLKHRFQDDPMETASFLLECTATLPNAEAISAQLLGGSAEQEDDGGDNEKTGHGPESEEYDFGDALIESTELSFTNPRGKLKMTLHENGARCKNAKDDQLIIPSDSVERMIVFPKPEDCRTSSDKVGDMVLLCLKDEVSFKNKKLPQVCLQLPKTAPKAIVEGDVDWAEMLVTAFNLDPERDVARVYNPTVPEAKRSGYTFASFNAGNTSTTTGGMPYIKCYKGVQDGALFPMQEGLLFFKPPMFLHHSKLHSIACGRGSGGSRYVDMVVTLDEDSQKELEFSNIHRDELTLLNGYIHNVLIPAMKQEAAGGGDDKNDADETSTRAASLSPINEPDEASRSGTRISKRKASRAAREATRKELAPADETESEGEEEENWDSSEEEPISDSDMSLSGVNEEPIDEDEDDDDDDYDEEEMEIEAEGISETESDDDEEEPVKKKKKKDKKD